MVNRTPRYLIDARFILQRTRNSFVGTPLVTGDGRDNTFTFGVARDVLRLRQTLEMDAGALVIGKDAKSIASEQCINDVISFLHDLRFPYVHSSVSTTLHIADSLYPQFSHILTADKRFLQLSTDDLVIVLNEEQSPSSYKSFLPESIKTEFGIEPDMVPTYLSLISSGPKSVALTHRQAVRVIEVCGDVMAIYGQLPRISSSVTRKKLVNNEREVKRFFSEATVNRSVKLTSHQIIHSASKIDTKRSHQVLRKYGFYSLVAFLNAASKLQVTPAQSKCRSQSYTAVVNRRAMEELEARIMSAKTCVIDSESDNKDPRVGTPLGVSFCLQEGRAYFLPLTESDLEDVSREDVLRLLKRVLRSNVDVIGHNIKYDYVLLSSSKIAIRSVHFDTMLAAFDCHGDWEFLNLKHLASTLLGRQITSYRDLVADGSTFLDLPFDEIVQHACQDADATFRLYRILLEQLKERGLQEQYFSDTMPRLRHVCDLECHGISVNRRKLDRVREKLLKTAVRLRDDVSDRIGNAGDLDSQEGLSEVLTGALELKRFTGVKNVSLRLLEQAAISEPSVRPIVQYKRVRKRIRSVEAILAGVVQGRVFPVFSLTRSPAGLVSTTKPNLFNIEGVHELQQCFGENVQEYFCDTQRALAILADVTRDTVLRKERRSKAEVGSVVRKHPVFSSCNQDDLLLSLVTGCGDSELSRMFLADQLAVAAIRHDMEKRYARSFEWIHEFRRKAIKNGYAIVSGKRKYIDGLRSSNLAKRKRAEQYVVKWLLRL